MFVYWGGFNGAKKYVKRLMGLNSKCYVEMYPYSMIHHKHKCHWFGRNTKRDLIWDITIDKDLVHRHVDSPGLLTSSKHIRKVDYLQGGLHGGKSGRIWPEMENGRVVIKSNLEVADSFISPDDIVRLIRFGPNDTIGFGRLKDPLRNKEDQRGFLDIKWKDSSMYYEVLKRNVVNDNSRKLIELTPDDIPKTHVVFPYITRANYQYEDVKIDGDKFKDYINVLPYKTNLVDCAINALENWGENRQGGNGKPNKVMHLYKTNKKELWKYLDCIVFDMNYMLERKLIDAGIKYEWINIDKDDWAKFFKVERNLPRLMRGENIAFTILTTSKYKKTIRKNYRILEDISREWFADKNKKDTRL